MSVRRGIWLWGPPLAYMAALFVASGISRPPAVGSDTWAHLLAYVPLGALLARSVAGGSQRVRGGSALTGWVLAAAWGISDEIHQAFVPGRHASVKDVVMDAVGAALGAFGLWAVARSPLGARGSRG